MKPGSTSADQRPRRPARLHTGNAAGRRLGWAAGVALLAFGWLQPGSAAVPPITPQFDHLTTGFELLGQHRDLACESCHANSVFKGTPHDCAACHGSGTAIRATAKPANHILSSERCESCHTPVAWNPAVNFDHVEVRGSCSSCHNNVQAQGKGPQHIDTNLECDVCHSTISWAGAAFSHAGIVGGCASCHDGVQATGMPPTHIPTGGAPCESCHGSSNFSNWAGAIMNHAAVTAIPCASCHEAGDSFIGVTIVTRPPLPHPAGGDCGACHTSTVSFNVGVALPANHIPLPAADASNCALCHANPSDFSVYSMNHANIAGNCSQCHAAGLSFANMAPPTLRELPVNHIPVGGTACESCHSRSNFATFAGTSMNHAGFTGTCIACHEAGMSFVGAPPIVTRPALPHVKAEDCVDCHTTTTFANASNFPTNHIPLPNGASSTCALCHSSATDYSIYAMNHSAVAGSACAGCHATNLRFANMAPPTLKQPPGNHIPVGSAACESCHAPTNFTTFAGTAMNHAAVPGVACAACHASGKSFVGPPAVVTEPGNHIPIGSTACESCHSPTNFATFSGTAMNHAGITSNCIACHGANLSFVGAPPVKTLPVNHIPTGTIACEGCHSTSNFTTFSGTAMNHAVVTAIACSACHEAGKSFVGSPAVVTRPAPPHVTTGECSTCHFSTTTFLGATNLPANHIPLPAADNSNCALCHTNASDYSVYTMNHVNIANNCAQCHGAGLSFANMAPPTLKEPPTGTPAHVPTGSIACELCHSPAVFTKFGPPTIMKHAAVPGQACDSCHELGMAWYGEPNLWVRPDANHHKGQDCGGSGCHSARDKTALRPIAAKASAVRPQLRSLPGSSPAIGGSAVQASSGRAGVGQPAPFDHRRAGAVACASCHNGTAATGKPVGHIATSNDCGSCHTVLSWSRVARVDHLQVIGGCASCHNGLVARGKSTSHVTTRRDCGVCHTSNAWTPARFDHGAVAAATCRSCHDSVHAIGMPARHIPTLLQCDSCHGTLAWMPAKLDHSSLPPGCSACHNNLVATGLPSTHMRTALDCATCHSYPDWSLVVFRHTSAAYPGEHRSEISCATCHSSNSQQVVFSSPADAGTCGGCHARDFQTAAHFKVAKGALYSASELRNCSGACHVYSDATLSTIVKSLPGPYHRVTDAAFKH